MGESTRQTKAHRKARLLAITVGAILGPFLLAGVAILGYAAWVAQVGSASEHWPTTEATILSAEVQWRSSAHPYQSKRYRFIANIQYAYEVDGQRYESDRVALTRGVQKGNRADAMVERFPTGSTADVWYDPEDPAFSLLIPGVPDGLGAMVVAGVAFLVVAMVIGIPVVRKYRSLRATGKPSAPRGEAGEHVEMVETPMELAIQMRPGRQGTSAAGGIAGVAIGLAIFFAVFFLPDLLANDRWSGKSILLLAGFGGVLLVGLWQLASYLRLRFERQTLHITSQEVILERRLAGICRRRRVQLSDGAAARLAWDHDADNKPIYAVIIEGADRPLRFATSLPTRDKQQLIERINEFLGVETPEPLGDPTK